VTICGDAGALRDPHARSSELADRHQQARSAFVSDTAHARRYAPANDRLAFAPTIRGCYAETISPPDAFSVLLYLRDLSMRSPHSIHWVLNGPDARYIGSCQDTM